MDSTTPNAVFMINTIDYVNSLAAKIDPRLYLYADYEPKRIDAIESYRFLFLQNVISAYALMFDCGKIVQSYVLAQSYDNSRPAVMDKLAQKYLPQYWNLVDLVMSIRNSSCHNMCGKYYNNDTHLIRYREYLTSVTGERKDLYEYSEGEWQKINICFVQLCTEAQICVIDYLHSVNDIPNPIEKASVVQYWLDSIRKCYEKDNVYMIEHTICSFYAPKAYPVRIERHLARRLLGESWKKYHNKNITTKMAISDYYKICENRISILLYDSKQCPTPALPLSFYQILTSDIKYIARNL